MPQSSKPGVLAGFTSVPGIGGKIADNIVAARKAEPFTVPDDMKRAPGMGGKKIDAMLLRLLVHE